MDLKIEHPKRFENTFCVIMAGGVGSRFWPLSRASFPKQFLDILGTGKSLLRQTFERFLTICPIENYYVVTSLEYVDIVLEQLPELQPSQVLSEPFRRNTAPCIAFTNTYIRNKNNNANIIVTPSDHLITNEVEFVKNLKKSLDFVENNEALLTLGIKPNRPETGYGYIQLGASDENLEGNISKVKTFTEKPSVDIAKVFYESGDFYWNSGIFVWALNTIDTAFENILPEVFYLFKNIENKIGTREEEDAVFKAYTECSSISIDYGIMERASNVYVQTVNFGWSDLGTWSSLHECSLIDNNGNAIISGKTLLYDTSRSIINIEPQKIAVIKGLNDFIVVDSKDALLICPKNHEQCIKQFTSDIRTEFGDNSL
ncbi:MAG: mannose-1-phosphate guanylyltransferase [Marinilabiliaceae bacterium]|nr:mannose-1-phosphate guanylyltransferase [Marinilabiliaceae bacterium]